MKSLLSFLLLALSAGTVDAAQQTGQLARADGTLIHYTLDAPDIASAGLVVLAQGSGCQPAASSPNLALVRAAFPAYTALVVEKSGIGPDTALEKDAACPDAFVDTFTLSQRIDDYESVLVQLETVAGPFPRIVLFGGSEGGLAMEALAARIHPAATILLSGSVGGTFGEMVLSSVPPEGQSGINEGFAQARANPDSTILGGHSHRFWADSLDHRSTDYLEATDSPFLLIYGGRDDAPIQPIRGLADRFAESGRCNLTYWEFPALDHGMAGPNGESRLPEIIRLAASWAEQPVEAC